MTRLSPIIIIPCKHYTIHPTGMKLVVVVFKRQDVSITKQWYGMGSSHTRLDVLPVSNFCVALFPRPPMNLTGRRVQEEVSVRAVSDVCHGPTYCHQGDAPVSELGDELVSIPVLVVYASSHLDGEWTVQDLHHSPNDPLKPSMSSHQSRASSLHGGSQSDVIRRSAPGLSDKVRLPF